jgi:hypothetical protein
MLKSVTLGAAEPVPNPGGIWGTGSLWSTLGYFSKNSSSSIAERVLRRRFIMVRTAMMTARPPTIPMMLKVAPTAALLLKKPEAAPALAVAPEEMVEPGGREPDCPDV